MRTYDIPYVKQSASSYPPLDYKQMDINTLKKHYLDTCMKCRGNISVCSKCQSPCEYGKRAVQLKANEVYNNPPVPLYGGKTLIEKAREENIKRRQATEQQKSEEKNILQKVENQPNKKQRIIVEGWYDKAYESDNPLQWIMDTFGMTKAQAKSKVYSHQHRYPELRTTKPLWKTEERKTTAVKQEDKESNNEIKIETIESKPNQNLLEPLEIKINSLMKLQDEYKQKAEHYQKLYQETKTKVDALFEALNILNE